MRLHRPLGLALLLLGCGPGADAAPPPPPGTAVVATDLVTGLGPVTDLAFLPDGRLVLVEKTGAVRLRGADGALTTAGTFRVDARSEKGLLGVVVDPAFETTRRLVFYLSLADADGGTDLDRHRVVSVPLTAAGTLDLAARAVLLSGLRGPANHDGGGLAVGPDGLLYVGVGDTGCNSGRPPEPPATPTNHFATCLGNANGKILRVALDGAVPAGNPLASVAAATACGAGCGDAPAGLAAPRREIYAWGFRNPWRLAFDPDGGRLWVGDVGEVTYEEVTLVEAGRHHGWPWREGAAGWPRSKCRETTPDAGDCVEPAYTCRHGAAAGGVDGDCTSITGGVFLPGPRWPAPWRGRYLFADNANGRLWTLDVDAARTGVVAGSRREVHRISGGAPVSLRVGPDGDVYAAVLPGRVVRLSPAPAP
ncbi:MAG: PQQ-dependent sugar dehydrogenase [Anaeromyxobacter sp.]|nr:PQQ-dependent sugar dehydrogenase [Anaeromyxobacter sp.]MBL0275537.1 PQQ-dependent sugar dehydrogenase [Anaeromyxobacter sp.]